MTRIPTTFSGGFPGAVAGAGGGGAGTGAEGADGGGGGAGGDGFCPRASGTASRRKPTRTPASLAPAGFLEVRQRAGAERPDGAAARFIALRCPTLAELNLFPPLSKQKERPSKLGPMNPGREGRAGGPRLLALVPLSDRLAHGVRARG